MKTIFALLFAVTICFVSVQAQVVTFDMKSKYGLTKDTVTNTGNNADSIAIFKKYTYISVQPVVTKISGTLTNATNVKLQGSVDGINWQIVNAADTMTIANQTTNTKVWIVPAAEACPFAYLRVYYVGSGTMVATLKAKVCFKE